jgi:hypothetical protein
LVAAAKSQRSEDLLKRSADVQQRRDSMSSRAQVVIVTTLLVLGGALAVFGWFFDPLGGDQPQRPTTIEVTTSTAIIVGAYSLHLSYVVWLVFSRTRDPNAARVDVLWLLVLLVSAPLGLSRLMAAVVAPQWAQQIVERGPHPMIISLVLTLIQFRLMFRPPRWFPIR